MPNPSIITALTPKMMEVAKGFVGEKEIDSRADLADPKFQLEIQKSGFMRGRAGVYSLSKPFSGRTVGGICSPVS